MAKFLYSAAMSLDGFNSGPGGDMSWMTDYLGPNPVVDQLIKQTGGPSRRQSHMRRRRPPQGEARRG
jgi:hypothetical protein